MPAYGLPGADLVGVAVFAASGASAAIGKRLDLFGVGFVGFIAALGGGILRDPVIGAVPPLLTAIGGGLVRDLLTGEIPVVLQRDIYAVVALGGAILVTILHAWKVTGPLPPALAAVLITGLRLVALYRRWSAPIAVP